MRFSCGRGFAAIFAAFVLHFSMPAAAALVPQACPSWWTALSNRNADPPSAALAFARREGSPACLAAQGYSCVPRPHNSSSGVMGFNVTQFDCTANTSCAVYVYGTAEDTTTGEFGNDLLCAYGVAPGQADPRKNPPNCGVGNPVNCATGAKTQIEVDFAKVNGLEFVRTYNSAIHSERTVLGGKWRHNWDRTIFATAAVA